MKSKDKRRMRGRKTARQDVKRHNNKDGRRRSHILKVLLRPAAKTPEEIWVLTKCTQVGICMLFTLADICKAMLSVLLNE